jgi:four helix bundle protein
MGDKYIKVIDMRLYQLSRELSKIGWEIYCELDWQKKKIMGDQFIRATDSFGANFVEGYARYHYLDRVKFMYNARASLSEACDYWVQLLFERKQVKEEKYRLYTQTAENCKMKLQNYISSIYKTKNNTKQ